MAAWKMLDQLCELALEEAGVQHKGRWNFEQKAGEVEKGTVAPRPPFDRHPDLWSRIMSAYANTRKLRNSQVHRLSGVDPGTGEIRGTGKPGQPDPTPVKPDEQRPFCQIAVGAAQAVIEGTLSSRQAGQLAWAVNQLQAHHHSQPPLDESPVRGLIPRVAVSVSPGSSNDVTLDFADIRRRALAASPASHYDVEIRLPDRRALIGNLEDAPPGQASVNLANPPDYLRLI